ncbi:MAG: hypothetical protein PHF07_01145 [Candidatus Pacebacteria bacterium]|jgi:hypothetical protein|nr:hypothetical protein [Candidatus Paceibacterota bacterium]
MSLNKKNLFIFSILALAFLFSANFALAQRGLEVPLLIEVEGVTLTETPILPDYVDYIFNLSVILAALIAFLSIIYGGVRHLTSAGNPAAMQDANDQIFAGVIGLIVILGSWILLTTINPQLIVINPQRGGTPEAIEGTGIFLCQTQELSPDTCEGPIFANRSAVSDEFNDATSYVIFKNPEDTTYGVVLHEDQYAKGNCVIILSGGGEEDIKYMESLAGEVSSLTVFRQGSITSGGVTLYEKKNYNEGCGSGDCDRWPASGAYRNEWNLNLDETGLSVRVEGSYLAALWEGVNNGGVCQVFTASDPDLASDNIGVCGFWSNLGCFRTVSVLPIQ